MNMPVFHSMGAVVKICIDKWESGVLSGRIYCPDFPEEAFAFSDICAMLFIMEDIFDRRGMPAAFHKLRKFVSPKPLSGDEPLERHRFDFGASADIQALGGITGSLCTFLVVVQTRLNATWQGEIAWHGQREPLSFASVLQMIFIIRDQVDRCIGQGPPTAGPKA
ncbi:MAG: hypothetical protein GXX99_03605 [Clostridiales bacterium]|nr:hypothetical protein [Clostridiales bacterium]